MGKNRLSLTFNLLIDSIPDPVYRDTDFLFQKLVFSVSENWESRFNFDPKRKFRFVIKIIHIKKHEFRFAMVNSMIFHVKT